MPRDGDDNQMMPPQTQPSNLQNSEEREPGVYVRSNQPENEIDFLWDRERKRNVEHERFHFGFFIGGAIVGSLITLAGCFLYFTGGRLFPNDANVPDPPAIIEEQNVTRQQQEQAPRQPEASRGGFSLPFFGKPKAEPVAAPQPKPETTSREYQVQPGDTLGSIAIKFYDSSNPDYIEKIQNANEMDNADTLKLGQKLVIPPKGE